MPTLTFPCNVPFIDEARVGQTIQLPFYPIAPDGFNPLQTNRVGGNRSEWWSVDGKTVEICQHPKRSEIQVSVPCIPTGLQINGTGANEITVYSKRYWDEWHASVEFGQEFICNASDIEDTVDYWHNIGSNPATYERAEFSCILKDGDVDWKRVIRYADNCRFYEWTLNFTLQVVRAATQVNYEYDI